MSIVQKTSRMVDNDSNPVNVVHMNKSNYLIDDAILVVGAHRSGTTWLGKIIDSHPTVLYRHEPDAFNKVQGRTIRQDLEAWATLRSLRVSVKRPFFRKSWRSYAGHLLRIGMSDGLALAEKFLPKSFAKKIQMCPVPAFGNVSQARVAIKSIYACDRIATVGRVLPESRTVLILRHPCGQADSVIRGRHPVEDNHTAAFAARFGVNADDYQALPAVAKIAWSWRQFNETALEAVKQLSNARVVVYEDMCHDPMAEVQVLFKFLDLDWSNQTAAFIESSSNYTGDTRYYGVMRQSDTACDTWRDSMSTEDQEVVRKVVTGSPLCRFWSDLDL